MIQNNAPHSRPRTILVVDDSTSFLFALLDHLALHGFFVVIARSAVEGLMRAELAQPDLILLDVVMPDVDGFEACRRLKANLATRDIPVIFMTGVTDPKQKVTGFDAGGVDYITKPFQIEEVLARINTHLALRKANRDLRDMFEALNRAKEELVQNEKLAALGALVAGIAHELNTPIGNSLMVASTFEAQTAEIRTYFDDGEHLKRSVFEGYLCNAHTAVDILMRNLHRAADMVTNFKQVAVDQASAQRRSFVLADVVAGNVLTLQPTIKRTPFSVEQSIEPDLVMESFPGPLGQVITNLVNNAIIHGYDGRDHGVIEVSAIATSDASILLNIKDNGNGIQADDVARIFDPFFTTKLGVGGSGLGLHIVHNIVTEVLGGRISVHSTPALGTTFSLTLPVVAPNLGA
ncbi:MAG: hybrid sensor histidine kinase/response regulator [Pseudomonadota bacterium]